MIKSLPFPFKTCAGLVLTKQARTHAEPQQPVSTWVCDTVKGQSRLSFHVFVTVPMGRAFFRCRLF